MSYAQKLAATVALLLLIAMPMLAYAQTGGGYDLTWSTIDGGGGTSLSGGYILNGTIGQPDANAPLMGGSYTLVGGFWAGAAVEYRIYLPVVLRAQAGVRQATLGRDLALTPTAHPL